MMRALVVTLAALAVLAALPAAAAAGASPFEWRGIVEGPYGAPWGHDARVRMLRWMGGRGMNAYVNAPKDDPYGRTYWRDPYPAGEQAEFSAEVRLARRRGIEWIPNMSPALPLIPSAPTLPRPPSRDLCFSCPADLQVVADKFAPFVEAGSRTVMVSFDDVSKVMSHPEDLARYGAGDEAFGRANGDFLTRLSRFYEERGVRVLTVGADYSGTSDTAYLRGLRSALGPGIEVMWTGTNVPAEPWTAADARAYGRLIGRRPLVWENWVNNDTAGNIVPGRSSRIFLGPYRRSAAVTGAVTGFFQNPMNEADLNKLPLATAAEWLRSPAHYDGRATWRRAVREIAGGRRAARDVRSALRAWAETSYGNRLDETEAPTFARRRDLMLDAYRSGALWPARSESLLDELGLVERSPSTLRGLPDRDFRTQAEPWIDAAAEAARAGRLGTRLLESERPALAVRRRADGGFAGRAAPPDPARALRLRGAFAAADGERRGSRRFTYGWRGGVAFDFPPRRVPENAMDSYAEAVEDLDREWLPRAASAARRVTVTLDGRRVALRADGRFDLSRSACGGLLVATDGAGGQTGVRLEACSSRTGSQRGGGQRGGGAGGGAGGGPSLTG